MKDSSIFNDLEKDNRFKKEYKKLKKIYQNLDKNTSKTVEKLVYSASFLAVLTEDLEKQIAVEGISEVYKHGKDQHGRKVKPEAEMYNKYLKLYTSIIKQLTDLLKRESLTSDKELDDFELFLLEGEKLRNK